MKTTRKFEINAGMFIRNSIRREIESLCFHYNVKCDVKEIKGLLSSTLFFELTGDKFIVDKLLSTIESALSR